jgi:uncharacterized protein DUF4338
LITEHILSIPDRDVLRAEVRAAIETAMASIDFKDKASLRAAHRPAVLATLAQARKALAPWESRMLRSSFAHGKEVQPDRIRPSLVRVQTEPEKRLFRYAASHWSIPVSNGYGRRLRFLVIDDTNEKLIGVIGLGDPVFALRDRDDWIGWTSDTRLARLRCVLDAFVLGAVPPYSALLGGKLVAALATSTEVQDAFWTTYGQRPARISGTPQEYPLALLTTTSAFGRSSMYNRVRLGGRSLWEPIGHTSGHGEFLFSGDLYDRMRLYVDAHSAPSARSAKWGPKAWRNRREVVRKALVLLQLPMTLHVHGLERSVYAAPLGTKTRAFLAGGAVDPQLIRVTAAELSGAALERWVVPRSHRVDAWRHWDSDEFRLWAPA